MTGAFLALLKNLLISFANYFFAFKQGVSAFVANSYKKRVVEGFLNEKDTFST